MTAPDPSPAAAIVDLAMLQMLIDAIPVSIYFKDLRGRFVRVNREHHRLLGLDDPAKVIGQTDFDFFTEAHSRQTCAEELEVIRTGRPIVDQEEKITCLDGREAWMSTTKFPWRESDGTIVGTIGLAREISRLNIAEEKLVEERNLLHQIIDLLPSRIYVKDRESRYLINNRAHLRSLGVERQEDALGRTAADFYSVARADQARADDRQVFSSGVPILDQEKSDFGPEGRTRWSLTAKVPLRDVRQEIVGLVGISHDITDRKRAEAELRLRSAEMEADLQLARRT
ncbi:MAG TPA: PAS domain-containing protein [Opitutaceae bacterium]